MTDDEDIITTETETEGEGAPGYVALRHMSPLDWARFGTHQIAYIRPVLVNGVAGISIHAADGTPIGAAPTAELAIVAIRQHEMAPARVH
jgi:hypothetical protein